MKKIIAAIFIVVVLAGCTSATSFGPCVGAFDDKDPKLIYKVDVWNIILGVFFFEIIAPPILVIANETFCPVGVK